MDSKKTAKKSTAKVKPKVKPRAIAKAPAKKTHSRSLDEGSDQQLILSFPGTVTPTGLMLHPALGIEEWSPIGVRLGRVKDWVSFAIGDWLGHGEAHYGEMYCVAPETRLLTRDLIWKPIGDMRVGERLIGFDEHRVSPFRFRRLKDAIVTQTGIKKMPCYRVFMKSGEVVIHQRHTLG